MTQRSDAQYHIVPLAIPAQTQITSLFEHYAEDNWSMLLDSANSQHVNGQFDFFVARPIATLQVKHDQCSITHPDGTNQQFTTQDPFLDLQKLLEKTLPAAASLDHNQKPHVPFTGGALGYFGYDLGRLIETLPEKAVDEYIAPDMAVGIFTWAVVKDNNSGSFYLTYLGGFKHPTANEIERLANNIGDSKTFLLTSNWQSNLDQEQYKKRLNSIHQYLLAGDCYQVNLAQRFNATYTGSDWSAYLVLRQANQAPFSAFIKLPDCSIVSISPERFLSVNQRQVETKPIKGTRPRSHDAKIDLQQKQLLLDSDKDRAENLMIVDLLRNDLSKACKDGSIHVPDLFKIESFEAVHHLVSTVTGELNEDKSPLDLLKGAFPGGSITGAPKIRAMEIIDELEPHRRHVYCGSIGYLDINGHMDTNICIRTLLLENNNIYCWAGGGIVLDSEANAEYQESFDKVSKILPVLEGCR